MIQRRHATNTWFQYLRAPFTSATVAVHPAVFRQAYSVEASRHLIRDVRTKTRAKDFEGRLHAAKVFFYGPEVRNKKRGSLTPWAKSPQSRTQDQSNASAVVPTTTEDTTPSHPRSQTVHSFFRKQFVEVQPDDDWGHNKLTKLADNDVAQPSSQGATAQSHRLPSSLLDPNTPVSGVYTYLRRFATRRDHDKIKGVVEYLVKDRHEQPNARLYEALLLANVYAHDGSAASVAALLDELAEENLVADEGVCHAALKALAVHPDPLLSGRILEDMRQRWIPLSVHGWHDLVAGYVKDLQFEKALEGLDDIRNAGYRVQPWLYDMVSYILCEVGEIDEALRIMKDRITGGESNISGSTWYHLFDAACGLLQYEAIFLVWRRRVEHDYLNPTSGQCIAVLTAAARHGEVKIAKDVFRVLSKRATSFESLHYELLIQAYAAAGDMKNSLTVLCVMNGAGLEPSEGTTRPLFKYLQANPPLISEAFEMLLKLQGDGRVIPVAAMNCIIEACVDQKGLDAAIQLYKELHYLCPKGPNAATFNHLFVGCRKDKRKDTGMFLAAEMQALNIKPDALTYDRLVLLCLERDEDFEDAFRYYNEMKSLGYTPRAGTLKHMAIRCAHFGDRRGEKLLKKLEELGLDTFKVRQMMSGG